MIEPQNQHGPYASETLSQHEPQAALSVEEFETWIDDMKQFMHLVLKIGFNFLHLYQHNPVAKSRYDELFTKDVHDFDQKIAAYFEEFVY